jgi:peptidoglycan hydrolase-like protein with peptidoglycan-binding domain
MSPHTDARALFRWRNWLYAAILAAIAVAAFSAGTAVAGTGGSAASSAGKSSAPTLRIGSKGKLVKQLQSRLKVKPASGYYGSKTARKVKFFQADHGLRADGIAGPGTLRALGLLATETKSGPAKLPAVLKKIAQCESGGNPRAVSPDGKYRGKYQFDQATWEAYGGSGDPAKASESSQDRVALKLYRARGTAPWPNCA